MTIISTAACIVLAIAVIIQIVFLFRKNDDAVSRWLVLLAALLLLTVSIIRSIQIRFIALTGTFESLIFYAAVICIIAFVYKTQRRIHRSKIISFISAFIALVFLAIASSPLTGKEALLPVPSLRSSWLLLHVSFAFIGESFFVVSFAAALAALLTKTEEKRLSYDKITYTAIAVGYPVFTAGALIFGAIWAQKAWGIWWSWDPKETWALITWLVYTFYLHLRLISKKTGKIISLVAVIGFLCTVFTLFGVNYLLPGLHSYK
ncbi:cytochrome C biogenesis protein [Treponema primitia ZAS-2]|uniref:Cytochrome C biogenesis protein n=1 Tax=Treponema primitia (strain ATCC BAA-887 / DSM 12427 / ZAS-2) TaxID=545694 RepID=F5YLN9_TREPZ|nr:cytochrome c biogenesis protein CcsA [Treponema primitia]AEF85279.1 cytochrome C biogenesis protein [Treponema primitia ZAS-2]